MDGENFANYVYEQLYEEGLPVCCNPTCLYEETIKYIKVLKRLGLRVKKVFVDSISNLDKMETYLDRRKKKDNIHRMFWNCLVQNGKFELESYENSCVSIANCAIDAVLRACIDQYGNEGVCLGGSDSDRDYCFAFFISLVILLITVLNTMHSFLQMIVISVCMS